MNSLMNNDIFSVGLIEQSVGRLITKYFLSKTFCLRDFYKFASYNDIKIYLLNM